MKRRDELEVHVSTWVKNEPAGPPQVAELPVTLPVPRRLVEELEMRVVAEERVGRQPEVCLLLRIHSGRRVSLPPLLA